MSRQLINSTQVCVILAVNVITKSGNREQLVTLPLLHLTPLAFTVWAMRQVIHRQGTTLATRAGEFITPLATIAKVFTIGFNALAFGLGVTQ